MIIKQGDIILVNFPFTDLSSKKVRPALVISNKIVNRTNDVIIAGITSNMAYKHCSCKITQLDVLKPFKGGRKEMMISYKKLVTIEKRIIITKINNLSETKMNELISKVKTIFDKD